MITSRYHTWIVSLVAVVFFTLGMGLTTTAQAQTQACETVEDTVAHFDLMATENKFTYEANTYKGSDAKTIRDYILTQTAKFPEFDEVLIAQREGFPMTFFAFYKDGCQVFKTAVVSSEREKIEDILRGI